jgi:hypothetical protein
VRRAGVSTTGGKKEWADADESIIVSILASYKTKLQLRDDARAREKSNKARWQRVTQISVEDQRRRLSISSWRPSNRNSSNATLGASLRQLPMNSEGHTEREQPLVKGGLKGQRRREGMATYATMLHRQTRGEMVERRVWV